MKIQEKNTIKLEDMFDVVTYNKLNKIERYDIFVGRTCRQKLNLVYYLTKKDEEAIPKASHLIRLKNPKVAKEFKEMATKLLFQNLDSLINSKLTLSGDITNIKEKVISELPIPKMDREFLDKYAKEVKELEEQIKELQKKLTKALIWTF